LQEKQEKQTNKVLCVIVWY